ncbi:hypothetical protein SAMN05216304_104298 [Bosea sp. OK403]|uniref:hypothetical protein n=1 Tax=Bosea sp. OK403 TaxID=1855286 RepID=UPI0008E5F829|nr:hypothetical protein [Bosea sp. OK403]SFJ06137.1 hypothetical protein SAMN05216304_104298 [Bosea sp. OK403]
MPSAFIRTILTAACLIASPLFAEAKTYSIPDPNPVAVITLPDDWESSEIDKGVQSTSDDETVYVSVEVTELKDAAQAIADAVKWLKSKDVVIDQASQEQSLSRSTASKVSRSNGTARTRTARPMSA